MSCSVKWCPSSPSRECYPLGINPLEPPARDRVLELKTLFAACGYASIPVVGPVLSAGLTRWMDSHYDRRLDAFLQQVGQMLTEALKRIDNLESRKLRPEDELVSALGIALPIAARTHQSEKRTALATAIKNTAVNEPAVSFDEVAMFLRFVDELTPLHLRVLWNVEHPDALAARLGWDSAAHTFAEALDATFPDLEALDSNGRYFAIERDLYNRFLMVQWASGWKLDRGSLALPLGTKFRQFIEFSG